jgi:hypothetical protein
MMLMTAIRPANGNGGSSYVPGMCGDEPDLGIYSYVGADPINFIDPSGLAEEPPIVVTGSRCPSGWTCYSGLGDFYATLQRNDGDGEIVVTARRPQRNKAPAASAPVAKQVRQQKPAYCTSRGYKVGNFIDNTIGGTVQNVGAGVVVGGLAVGLSTAITGVGAGAGGGIIGIGGVVYAAGTAVSTIGNGIKWLSGQSVAVTAGNLLSYPTTRLGPISQVITEKTLSSLVKQNIKDPCE